MRPTMWMLIVETRASWGESAVETSCWRWRWLALLVGAMETTDDPTGQMIRTMRVERLTAATARD